MATARSVIQRLSVLLLGEGAARLLGVATYAALARALGLEGVGVLSFGMSLALVLECLMDLGQNAQLGRVVAQDPDTGLGEFTLAATNKSLIAVILAAVVATVMTVGGSSGAETLTVFLLLVWAAGLSVLDSLRSAARSLGHFRFDSTVNGAESLLRFSAVALVWAAHGGLVPFACAFAAESWLAVILVSVLLRRRHPGLIALPGGVAELRRFLAQAAPFGVAVMSLSAFYNLDQVFVRTLVGASANGLYATAARVSFTASVVGGLLAMVTYPDLARMSADLDRFRRYMLKAVGLAALIGLITGSVIFAGARPILEVLFGTEFGSAADILRVLVVVVVFRGVSSVALYAANALGLSRKVAAVAIVFAACNVTANVVLLPIYGATAAAWISAAGETALATTLVMVSLRHVSAAHRSQSPG